MDNPLFLVTKGLKAKKKRLGGGGGGGAGTYPESSAPSEIGCLAVTINPQSNPTHATVQIRDSSDQNGAFCQLKDAAGTTNLNAALTPDFPVADYIATVLNGEPAGNFGGVQTIRGDIQFTDGAGNSVVNNGLRHHLTFLVALQNNNNYYNDGSVAITMAHNPQNAVMNITNSPASQLLAGNPPVGVGPIECVFDPMTQATEIILEFRVTGNAKLGNQTTSTTSPQAGALKNGSCYLRVVFP